MYAANIWFTFVAHVPSELQSKETPHTMHNDWKMETSSKGPVC